MEKLSLGDEGKSSRCRKYYGSGYGSARIRIGWFSQIRIRIQEQGNLPNLPNLPDFQPFKKAFVQYLRRYVLRPNTYIQYSIFLVKNFFFVTAKSEETPLTDPHGSVSAWWDENLDPDLDPYWNQCGSATLLLTQLVPVQIMQPPHSNSDSFLCNREKLPLPCAVLGIVSYYQRLFMEKVARCHPPPPLTSQNVI